MRAIIVRVAAEARPASERVEKVRQEITDYVKDVEAQTAATRTARKRQLWKSITGLDDILGQGVRGGSAPTRRQAFDKRRSELAAELDVILDREASEWLADRGFESHMESRPRKALFQELEVVDPERQMPIESISDGGSELHSTADLVRSATAAFSGRFRQPYEGRTPRVADARRRLLRHVRHLPTAAAQRVEADAIVTPGRVREAINAMPLHKTPGEDGFPADFYRAFSTELAPLLSQLYHDCLQAGEMTPLMRGGIVSLIFKKKGSRQEWKNYRPLTVSATEYKILAKTMQLAADEVAQHVISPSQFGFQRCKYIGEATAFVQLLAQYCRQRGAPGLMLMLDGEQAYDRCQWDWLDECLEAMAFPDSFRGLVRMLYTRPELRVKVNGVCGDAFSPLNGVKQGCPLSPFLYLIALQPLIDTLEHASSNVPGVRVPGPLGRGMVEVVATAYADDVSIFLRGFHGLAEVGPLMERYHLAAGAATNWGKTEGLRLGSLRGALPDAATLGRPEVGDLRNIRWLDIDSDDVHAGCTAQISGLPNHPQINHKPCVVLADGGGGQWEVEVGGSRHTVAGDCLRVTATRYLGPWMGGDEAVSRAWDTRVVSGIADRLEALRAAGLPCTVYGRVLCQKNLLFGKAVFFVMNQLPANLNQLLVNWQVQFSNLLWSTTSGDHRAAAGEQRGRPPALVRLSTAAQDHGDGGCRALHVQRFAEALRVTWVRRLLDPCDQPWKNLVWHFGFGGCEPALQQCGEHVLCSASSLRTFAQNLPPLFREALLTWGRMRTPLMTAEARERLTLEAVSAMPLCLNPAACEPGHEPVEGGELVALRRTSDAMLRERRENLSARLARQGYVVVRDLLPHLRVEAVQDGTLRARLDEDSVRAALRNRCRYTLPALRALVALWPQRWLAAIHDGAAPIGEGDWVCLTADGERKIGRVSSRGRHDVGVVRVWDCDRSNRLSDSGTDRRCRLSDLRRVLAWLETPVVAPERAHYQNSMTPRRRVQPPTWRYAGALGDARVDPTAWTQRGWETLRAAPHSATIAKITNRDVYAMLLSELFQASGDACAFPHAFARPSHSGTPGCWWHLLPTAAGLADSDRLVRRAVCNVFTVSHTQALPLACRQSLWLLHAGGLPVGPRTGGSGLCPIIDAMRASGLAMGRVAETHEQIAMRSPTARLVWRHVAAAWRAFCPGHNWATSAALDGRPSDDACRAILLGLRPDGEHTLREPFALLRGLAVHEIVRHRHAVWLSASRDGPDVEYDYVRAAARIYARLRAAFGDAVAQERRRCLLLQQQMRAAGLPASSCFGAHSPMTGWRATWEDTGVCTVQGGLVTQQLLPDQPLTNLAVTPLARARRCPREDWAPPAAVPHALVQLFVTSSEGGDAFGAAVVSGGDADLDTAAAHVADRVGRVITDDRNHPAYVGADAYDEMQAHLVGVVAGLEALAARGDTAPLLLRLSDPAAAECVAGVWEPAAASRLRSQLLSLLNAARARRGHVWVSGYDRHRLHAFGERAAALAAFGSMPRPGGLPQGWVPAAPPDPLWAGEDCPVCMEEFSSPWPTQDAHSRAPPCRWYCPHAVCRSCDAEVQRAANSTCPLCRAPRRVHMHP